MQLVPVNTLFSNYTFTFSHNKIDVSFAVPFFSSGFGHCYNVLFPLPLFVPVVVAFFFSRVGFLAACIQVFPMPSWAFPMASYDVPFIYGLFAFFTVFILLRTLSAHAFFSFLVDIL